MGFKGCLRSLICVTFFIVVLFFPLDRSPRILLAPPPLGFVLALVFLVVLFLLSGLDGDASELD